MSHIIRKLKLDLYFYAKTKMQISCAVTAQLISIFVFPHTDFHLKFRNFKFLAFFFDFKGQFVSDLNGNFEDCFSRDAAEMIKDKSLKQRELTKYLR